MSGQVNDDVEYKPPRSKVICCIPIRKPVPDLTTLLVPPAGVDLIEGGSTREAEAIQVASLSFCGTEQTDPEWGVDWMMGKSFRGAYDDARRIEYYNWFLSFLIRGVGRIDEKRSLLFAARRTDNVDGIGAVCVVTPHLHGLATGTFAGAMENMSILAKVMRDPQVSLGPLGIGKMSKGAGQGVARRCWKLAEMFEEQHKKACLGPHLYVMVMAVDPSAQGQGLCSKLMRFVSAMADALQIPCYLECTGERNPVVYGRFGYKTVNTLQMPADEDNENPPCATIMVRPWKPASTA